MKRKQVIGERVLLIEKYLPEEHVVIGRLIVDYHGGTREILARSPERFAVQLSKETMRTKLGEVLATGQRWVGYLERGTRIVVGLERQIINNVIKSGGGPLPNGRARHKDIELTEQEVILLRHTDFEQVKGAPIVHRPQTGTIVVGTPCAYRSIVPEDTLISQQQNAQKHCRWMIGILSSNGEVAKLRLENQGKIIRENSRVARPS